jgi:succinylglutamate desuccinylase
MSIATTDRKQQLAHRIHAFTQLQGKVIHRIEITETGQIDMRFTDQALLTLACDDFCRGHRYVLCDADMARLRGETFESLTLSYMAGELDRSARHDIIRFTLTTTNHRVCVDLHNHHGWATCQRFQLRWKIALSGSNHEGEF